MYSTCLFCSRNLGRNEVVPSFPVGRRLAFDVRLGRLWVICPHCARWNLSPLDERLEAIETCERRFRAAPLRYSTENIGLAYLPEGLELVRIGRALRPELAAWRYSRVWPGAGTRPASALSTAGFQARRAMHSLARLLPHERLGSRTGLWYHLLAHPDRIVDAIPDARGDRLLVRYRDLPSAELIRPESHEPWRLVIRLASGTVDLSGTVGLRTAGKLLAPLNGRGASLSQIRDALLKLRDAGDPQSYFSRVARLALRTAWGRSPSVPPSTLPVLRASSEAERLALYLTSRSFWAHGAIGSEPRAALADLPFVDRLALEMAVHEDSERLVMEGELAGLHAAWREAEEIAAIADTLLRTRTTAQRLFRLFTPNDPVPVAHPTG
jgi:hypothetical protein